MTRLLILSMLLIGGANILPGQSTVSSSAPYSINWPSEYLPEDAKFFVHNEIDIQAAPQKVWELLIQAEIWPDWYEGASEVNIQNSETGILDSGAVFTWKTMGLDFESTILEFEPYTRLGWESNKKSIQGYHAWLIIPTETGCRLITEESQKGWLTFFEKTFQPNKLRKLHDIWLANIKAKAEQAEALSQRD